MQALDEKRSHELAGLEVREKLPAARPIELPQLALHVGQLSGERALLGSVERPITLLEKRRPNRIVDSVAPRQNTLGLFLPYTPLHALLFDEGGFDALVMTSGNISEEPIACGNDEALHRLHDLADWFLTHDRDIHTRCDDSVMRVVSGRARSLRRPRLVAVARR